MSGIACALAGVVSLLAESQGGIFGGGPSALIPKPIIREALSPKHVPVFNPAVNVDSADAGLEFRYLGRRWLPIEDKKLRIHSGWGDGGNGRLFTEIGWNRERRLFGQSANGDFPPVPHIVGWGLSKIFDYGEASRDPYVRGMRFEVGAVSHSDVIDKHVSPKLAPAGSPRNFHLKASDDEEGQGQDGNRVSPKAEGPSPDAATDGALAGLLIAAGVSLIGGGWWIARRRNWLGGGLFAAGALAGTIGWIGLAEALCNGGLCQ